MPNENQKKYKPEEDFPELSKHNNFMARVLTPQMYAKLRDTPTPTGYTFDQAIQTGVDNPGVLLFIIIFPILHSDEMMSSHSAAVL